jgi:cytoskeletal protein CcmA (bactofilin family)
MFSKGTTKTEKDSVPSIISVGTQVVGDITTDGEVQVDGKVEGNIRCESLIVADTGEVTGKVVSDSIALHGTLTGTVQSKSVRLSSTARLIGDVTHESLTVDPGAHFKGQCIPAEAKKEPVVVAEAKKDGLVVLGARNALPPPKAKEAAQA